MVILVPGKPVILLFLVLIALLLLSAFGLSLRKGKDPFASQSLHDARTHHRSPHKLA